MLIPKRICCLLIACSVGVIYAQQPLTMQQARLAYQQQQALEEVPRLMQQFDQLLKNQDAIVFRLQKLEASSGPDATMQAEIAALRAEVAELRASIRREQDAMRRELVQDLAGRISKMSVPPPAPVTPAPVATQPYVQPTRRTQPPPPAVPEQHYEYIVEKGQTLSLIAQGFGTTVPRIIALNPGLKAHSLQVGQKLIIPVVEEKKPAPTKTTPARNSTKKGKK